ncbi:MAG: 30S ribosomal protein S20 [Bacteroidetes bacterium]|nr:30S ribosomal protein S20 [Bacteroidota bacterium]
MANTKNAKKAARQAVKRRLHNRYYAKTTRNAIRVFRATDAKGEASGMINKLASMIDKLAKRNIIHDNKASNLKSKLMKRLNSLN